MGLFTKKNETAATPSPVEPAAPSGVWPSSGTINLSKGDKISLTKTDTGVVKVSNGWKAKGKDYDLKALVRYRDGRLIYVGAANDDEVLSTPEGAVCHGGDVKQGSGELETIAISWHPDIASVALSSYSALENGAGSFKQYGVYVTVENGSQVIGLQAADVSANGQQYTLCFGEVQFEPGGGFTVVNLELYSRPGSENRIGYQGDCVAMDVGPVGRNK